MLASDHTTERDFASMCPDREIAIYVNRIQNENPATVENLRKMAPKLSETAALILPDEALDVIAYSCTSASVVIGDEAIREAVREAKPGVPCVTPTTAALAAFDALSVRTIDILAPYLPEVSARVAEFFESRGLAVASLSCLGIGDDRDIARVAPESVVDVALGVCDSSAEALFIPCTALRALEAIERIESGIGKPVITSNQAMFWQALRTAGSDRSISGFGRLLARGRDGGQSS